MASDPLQDLAPADVHVRVDGEGDPSLPNKGKKNDPEKDASPKAEEARRAREPAPGTLVPKKGIPGLHYRLNRRIGRGDIVPELGPKEWHEHMTQRKLDNAAVLNELVVTNKITVCNLNGKGSASKTRTGTGMGSVVCEDTRQIAFMIPATVNTATATAAFAVGMDENALSISRLADELPRLKEPRDIFLRVRPTPSGFRVVGEDTDEDIEQFDILTLEGFKAVADRLRAISELLILDCGNDAVSLNKNTGDFSLTLESALRSDVLLLPTTAFVIDTLDKLPATFRSLLRAARNLEELKQQKKLATKPAAPFLSPHYEARQRIESAIPLEEKTKHAIVVVSGVRPGIVPPGMEKMQEQLVKDGFKGKIMTIPFDESMANRSALDLTHLNIETYVAYQDLSIAAYHQAAELRVTAA